MKSYSSIVATATTTTLLLIFVSVYILGQSIRDQKEAGRFSPAIIEPGDRTLSPFFLVKSEDPSLEQFPLKSTSADVNIAGVIADVLVTQEYSNEGKKPIEAIYVFPASTRAAVYRMKMTIGERTIQAKITERDQARREYETARERGQNAALLEEERPNVFRMNVSNIMPGDRVKVELSYTELLVPEEGIYRFIYPTVVGPRYSNKKDSEVPLSEKWIANPYTHQGEKPSYSFGFACRINAGLPLDNVKCSSHSTQIRFLNSTAASITLDPEGSSGGNRDVIIEYRLSGDRIQTGLLLYPGADENFFLAMIQPPKQVTPDDIPPREYVFIVDVSGSMIGFPLEISKKLMKDLIGNLKKTDRFNVLLFAGGSELFSESSVAASNENLDKAIQFIDQQQGGGGTELLPALRRALQLKGTEGFSRSFVIATDGYVDIEKEAFNLVRSSRSKANFFTFGIGTSVNRYLIEGLAKAGGGEPFVVINPEGANAEATKFRKYVDSPVLSHITVRFEGFETYDVEPSSIQDVFAHRPVLIYGKYRGKPGGSLVLEGNSAEGKYENRIILTDAKVSEDNHALKFLWAREKISSLDDFDGTGDEFKGEVTRLGLKYNLLTRYTSFLAIDSRIRNDKGEQVSINQPLPLPEGVSDYAVGGMNSQTINFVAPSMLRQCEIQEPISVDAPAEEAKLIFSVVEQMPEYPGGEEALKEYLTKNLAYPEFAKENGIHGTVYISFVVEKDGSISDVKVLRGIGGGCDEEAIRIVKRMPKWIPAKQNVRTVRVQYNLPIKFNL
jgi:Ca-activated chloride channel family protein